MPCYDSRDNPAIIRKDHQKEINILQDRADELTRMLCGLCSCAHPVMIDAVPDLRRWWTNHQELDRIRLKSKDKRYLSK